MNDNAAAIGHVDPEITAYASVFKEGLTKAQVEFLYSYIVHGSLRKAAKHSGVHKARHFEWKRKALYVECFEEARRLTLGALEDEAQRRAVDGVVEPVFYRDKLVGHKRRYSDSLLIRLLEANGPARFGPKPELPNQSRGPGVVIYNGRAPTDEEVTADHGPPQGGVRVFIPDNHRRRDMPWSESDQISEEQNQ